MVDPAVAPTVSPTVVPAMALAAMKKAAAVGLVVVVKEALPHPVE